MSRPGLSEVEEAAVLVLCSLSPSQLRRLKRERGGNYRGDNLILPVGAITELLDALDKQDPGLIDRVHSNLKLSQR
jgi:hypothetical protein